MAAVDVDITLQNLPEEEYHDISLLTVNNQWNILYRKEFLRFLNTFYDTKAEDYDESNQQDFSHYQKMAIEITRFGLKHILLDLQDIYDWPDGVALATFIQKHFMNLWVQLDEVIDSFVKKTLRHYFEENRPNDYVGLDEPEFLQNMATYEKTSYYINFTTSSSSYTVRQFRTEFLGELINVRGTATRLSDVRPELKFANFECELCHSIIENVQQQFKYTEPTICVNADCHNRAFWKLRNEECKFADWQKLKLQENSAEIPAGSVPRSIEVILTKNLTDRCKPGDKVVLSGALTAIPDVSSLMKPKELTRDIVKSKIKKEQSEQGQGNAGIRGLKALGVRSLTYRLVFFASDVKTIKSGLDANDRNYDAAEIEEEEYAVAQHLASIEHTMKSLGLSSEIQEMFFDIANSTETLNKLVTSVAPEIFGCENVKKGILLMLVGGVEKTTGKDNLKLRGDINVCIVGDPGTAKSQLLKYVHQFAAGRAVYAAGFTSTAAGLTVSVHKDPDQGDSVIEAGALMLADQGICCIDEFDKIDNKDMVAIHEAMEQKTISICKAGIQATLNARASILAACNPRYGRYDSTKTFRQNIRLNQPIISRFDLFFTMIDTTDRDALIARHIVNLHMQLDKNHILQKEEALLSPALLRNVARSCNPSIDISSRNILVDTYVSMRNDNTYARKSAYVTVRQLESLLRLSEAIAKFKFSSKVLPVHVKEARNLIQASFINLQKSEIIFDNDDENEPENSDQTEKPKTQQALVITGEEYEKISTCLIDHLRAIEIELISDPNNEDKTTEAIVVKEDLIAWYIENVADLSIVESEKETEEMYRKLYKIIGRMEEMRDMNVPIEGGGSIVQSLPTLRLHPNLASDFIPDRPTPLHANLTTEFFTGEQPRKDSHPSWTIDDQAFIDYMYGWTEQSK